MSGVLAALSRRADIVMAGGTAAGSAPEPGFPVPAATVIHSRMMIYRILLGIILAAALGGLCLSVLSEDMLWAVLMLALPAAILGGGMIMRAKDHVMAASIVLLLLALPAMALSLWMFFLWTMFTFGSGRVN